MECLHSPPPDLRLKQAMKQTLTQLLLTLPVVWLVVSLVFLLIHLVPGDPILQMLGEGAPPGGRILSEGCLVSTGYDIRGAVTCIGFANRLFGMNELRRFTVAALHNRGPGKKSMRSFCANGGK